MSNGDTEKNYRWEWPADRTPEIRLLAKVAKLEKQKEGFLGINRSPSIAANLPDAQVLTGLIVDGHRELANRKFSLVLPKVEAADIAANDYVALGIIGSDICICIAKVPAGGSQAQQMEWVANWQCAGK
jgi:hypothetical protein